ncbi:MAG: PKD domain-containing protein, partial [Thermotogota bacterium]
MKNLRTAIAILILVGVLGLLAGCVATNSPHATFTRTPKEGYPPLEVQFDASASTSPNGDIVTYEWDFGDDDTGTGETV